MRALTIHCTTALAPWSVNPRERHIVAIQPFNRVDVRKCGRFSSAPSFDNGRVQPHLQLTRPAFRCYHTELPFSCLIDVRPHKVYFFLANRPTPNPCQLCNLNQGHRLLKAKRRRRHHGIRDILDEPVGVRLRWHLERGPAHGVRARRYTPGLAPGLADSKRTSYGRILQPR